jgi:hypothetical protein
MSEVKGLIAYYSRAGYNYVGDKIVNLPVGNTEVAAKRSSRLRLFSSRLPFALPLSSHTITFSPRLPPLMRAVAMAGRRV